MKSRKTLGLTGSVQEKRGRLYAVINWKDENGKRHPTWRALGLDSNAGSRKANAALREALNEFEDELERKEQETPKQGETPFYPFMVDWLAKKKPQIQHATYESYNNMIVGRIRRAFEKPGIYVENITPEMLEKFYQGIMKEGCVANTVIHYIAVLKQALQYAVKQGLIPSNPCDRVDRPKKNKFHGEHYSSKEVMTLLALVQDDPIYIPVLLASYYGLRRSEALGLRWSRVDFQRKQIHIDCKVYEQRVDGKFIAVPSEEMKNESSRRTLPLIPEVEKALLRQREKQSLYRKLHGKSYTTEFLDFVCVDPFGKLMRPNFVTEHFDWFLRQNGMRKIRFHDLRHTCASLLIANGVDLKSIQEWLGHSTFSTTADIYAHLDYTSKENSAGVMSKILGGGDEPEDAEEDREEQDFSMSM